jgi:hypothetical protein
VGSLLPFFPPKSPPRPSNHRLVSSKYAATSGSTRDAILERHMAMLPTAVESATLDACCCYRRRLALLPWACYRWRVDFAILDVGRCYRRFWHCYL